MTPIKMPVMELSTRICPQLISVKGSALPTNPISRYLRQTRIDVGRCCPRRRTATVSTHAAINRRLATRVVGGRLSSVSLMKRNAVPHNPTSADSNAQSERGRAPASRTMLGQGNGYGSSLPSKNRASDRVDSREQWE